MSVDALRTGAEAVPARGSSQPARGGGAVADAFSLLLAGAEDPVGEGGDGASSADDPRAKNKAIPLDEAAAIAVAVPVPEVPPADPAGLLAQGAFVAEHERPVDGVAVPGRGMAPLQGVLRDEGRASDAQVLTTAHDAAPRRAVSAAKGTGGDGLVRRTVPELHAPARPLAAHLAAHSADVQAPTRFAEALAPALQAAVPSPESPPPAMPRSAERGRAAEPAAAVAAPAPVSNEPSAWMAPVDAAAASLPTAERMTEQVSWWLSQKTQGAEVTLDLAAGQSVSFSVQVQGHEAQVAFRSDQPELRQMLQQAGAQLRELFGQEGLLLSGVSVGAQSEGRGDDQAGARDRATVRGVARLGGASDAEGAPPSRIRTLPAGRALDLYV